MYLLQLVCDIVDQSLGSIPAQTWVCDGLSVDVIVDGLIALLDITLYHNALDQLADIIRDIAAVQYLRYDTWLLVELLVGVGVVCIDDAGRIDQIHFLIHFVEQHQVFLVIVWMSLIMFVDCTTQDRVCQWVSVRLNFVLTIQERVVALCCNDRVHHNA